MFLVISAGNPRKEDTLYGLHPRYISQVTAPVQELFTPLDDRKQNAEAMVGIIIMELLDADFFTFRKQL